MPADGCGPSVVVDLEEWKASRLPPLRVANAEVRGGRVVVRFGDHELELTPASARTWARGLEQLAQVAELDAIQPKEPR
jgi:hypothetical protein